LTTLPLALPKKKKNTKSFSNGKNKIYIFSKDLIKHKIGLGAKTSFSHKIEIFKL
jgi:hypothetical protein